MIRIEDKSIVVETKTLTARIENGFLMSLRSRFDGSEWIQPFKTDRWLPLQLLYGFGLLTGFTPAAEPVTITPLRLSDHRAEFRIHGWDCDGVIVIGEDEQSGDLLIEPSVYSSRPGVMACRWVMPGLPDDVELVAPFFQGIKLKLDDELIKDSHWRWPWFWEAGLAILQGKAGGFWVHTQDTRYRYKALKVGTGLGTNSLAFDTEAYGPFDNNLAAGGVVWRLSVYQGDWKVPAEQYRKWLWQAWNLAQRQRQRKSWTGDIRLAVSWCNGDPALLDAMAEKIKPNKVLIHLSEWRTDPYDENYPTYIASEKARAFIAKGREMGFHIVPHCNSVDMDPTHPAYAYLRDFVYRDSQTKGAMGWGWEAGKALSVPNSNAALMENRQRKVMVKIHPGLSMWRSILSENIRHAVSSVANDAVFIDVTLTTGNLHNCLVENMTSTEGMLRLIDRVAEIEGGLCVAGEGLNEITAQGLCFAQAHLFRSWHATIKGLERTAGCPLNAFLFEGLARTFGYSGLALHNEEQQLRSRVHLSLGAIPTFAGLSPDEVRQPKPPVKELFDLANSQ